MSVFGWFQGKGANGFGYETTAEQVVADLDLTGKTYLITGVTSGLGLESMRVLRARGATVIGAARKAEGALSAGADHGVSCELSEPASVRAAVEAVRALGLPLDGILANAGIMALPSLETKHGVELQLLTNHVGHFILIAGVLDLLTPTGRVVMLSSTGHQMAYREGVRLDDFGGARGYTRWGSYGQSKLANLLFAKGLAKRLPLPTQATCSVHPGVIGTNLMRHLPTPVQAMSGVGTAVFMKTVGQGAATQVYALVHPKAADLRGEYLSDCQVVRPSKRGEDAALAEGLWTRTEELVASL